jgi:hypothetical protein
MLRKVQMVQPQAAPIGKRRDDHRRLVAAAKAEERPAARRPVDPSECVPLGREGVVDRRTVDAVSKTGQARGTGSVDQRLERLGITSAGRRADRLARK